MCENNLPGVFPRASQGRSVDLAALSAERLEVPPNEKQTAERAPESK